MGIQNLGYNFMFGNQYSMPIWPNMYFNFPNSLYSYNFNNFNRMPFIDFSYLGKFNEYDNYNCLNNFNLGYNFSNNQHDTVNSNSNYQSFSDLYNVLNNSSNFNSTASGRNIVNTQLETESKEEKDKNNGWKIAGGITVVAGLAIAADYIFAKGKHVKSILKRFNVSEKTSNNNVKKTEVKPDSPLEVKQKTKVKENSPEPLSGVSGAASDVAKFNDIAEAKRYFSNLGLDADLAKCSSIEQAEFVANSLKKIKDAGIDSQVKSLTFTQFDEESIIKALTKRGLTREALPAGDISYAFGASESGHIFINPNGAKYMMNGSSVPIHEVGHYHRNVLKDNFLKYMELDSDIVFDETIGKVANKLNISKQEVVNRLTTKLHSEVNSYSNMADENFADMFSLMVEGKKEFSKGAMLFYDMAGGARLPNKLINNIKYDDYMNDLYLHADEYLVDYIK